MSEAGKGHQVACYMFEGNSNSLLIKLLDVSMVDIDYLKCVSRIRTVLFTF